MQYVNSLTPQIRRRTYVVLISPQLRTLDTYLAFANGVNLTVHPEDVASFSQFSSGVSETSMSFIVH